MRDAHLCGFFVSRVNPAFQHSFPQRVVLHARTISCFRKGTNMANIKSQKKRNITNEKAHQRNKACKSELKLSLIHI